MLPSLLEGASKADLVGAVQFSSLCLLLRENQMPTATKAEPVSRGRASRLLCGSGSSLDETAEAMDRKPLSG